jgi:hypothetical protein
MKALIDGDPIVYAAGFSGQKTIYEAIGFKDGLPISMGEHQFDTAGSAKYWIENLADKDLEWEMARTVHPDPLSHVLHKVKLQMQVIIGLKDVTSNVVYLSPIGPIFRHTIYPEYKANRKDIAKPIYYQEIRDYLRKQWKATVVEGYEADDMLGIEQCTATEETIICSTDKDLDMIPGWHYNYGRNEQYFIDHEVSTRNFYSQLLIGDRVDNIPGCPGIGVVKAERELEGAKGDREYYFRCLNAYYRSYGGKLTDVEVKDTMHRNARLLWILRAHDAHWEPPV